MLTIALDGGPMKTIPAFARFSAKVAFSLRKPYPGWTAFEETLQYEAKGELSNTHLRSTAMANVYDLVHPKLCVLI